MSAVSMTRNLLALLVAAALALQPALAEGQGKGGGGGGGEKHGQKHEKGGGGKGGDKHAKAEKHGGKADKQGMKADKKEAKTVAKAQRADVKVGGYFSDSHRTVVRTYYVDHYGGGRACPPGLAKKNNGCMPPGQAKKYIVGQPLPAGVVYYVVPQPVLVQLPPPPIGHRYVMIAGDIVLLAVGTQMVVDALTNLIQ